MIVIISIIIAALSLFLGSKGYTTVMGHGCNTELTNLQTDLKASADAISSQTGSVEGKKYTVPCKIEKVYFIDLNEEIDEDIANEGMEINDSYTSGVKKNVFFMKDDKVKYSIYIESLKLEYPYYRCFFQSML